MVASMAIEESNFIRTVQEYITDTGKTYLEARQTDGIVVLKADDAEDCVVIIHNVDDESKGLTGSAEHSDSMAKQICLTQIKTIAKLRKMYKYRLEIDGIIVFKGNQKQYIVKLHEVVGDKPTVDINKSNNSLMETNKSRKQTEFQQHMKQDDTVQFTKSSNIKQNGQESRTFPGNDSQVKKEMIVLQTPEVKHQQNASVDIERDSGRGKNVENENVLSPHTAVKHQANTPMKTSQDNRNSMKVENEKILSGSSAVKHQLNTPMKTSLDSGRGRIVENERILSGPTAVKSQSNTPMKTSQVNRNSIKVDNGKILSGPTAVNRQSNTPMKTSQVNRNSIKVDNGKILSGPTAVNRQSNTPMKTSQVNRNSIKVDNGKILSGPTAVNRQSNTPMKTSQVNRNSIKVDNGKILSGPTAVNRQSNTPMKTSQDNRISIRVEHEKILSALIAAKRQLNTPMKTSLDSGRGRIVENERILSGPTAVKHQTNTPMKTSHDNRNSIRVEHEKILSGPTAAKRQSNTPMKTLLDDNAQNLLTTSETIAETQRRSRDGKELHESLNLNCLSVDYYATKGLQVSKMTNISCEKCGNVCETILLLEMHYNIAHQLSTCLVCSKTVANKRNLQRHIQCKHLEPGFACQLCGKKFHEKYCLRRHLRTCANEKPKKTSVGVPGVSVGKNKKKAYSKGNMRKCCDESFLDHIKYKRHMFGHKGDPSMTFQCFFCEITFSGFPQFSIHQQRTHTKKKSHESHTYKLERQQSRNSASCTKPSNNPNAVGKVIGQTHSSMENPISRLNDATNGNKHVFNKIHSVYTEETQPDEQLNASVNGNKKIRLSNDFDARYDTSTNIDGDDETVTCGHCMMSFMSSKYLEVHLKNHPDHKL